MLVRHEKELEQIKRMNLRKEDELVKRQAVERRQLPKRIRSEMKAREMMFRESMRISMTNVTDSEAVRDRLKKVRKLKMPILFNGLLNFQKIISLKRLKILNDFFVYLLLWT